LELIDYQESVGESTYSTDTAKVTADPVAVVSGEEYIVLFHANVSTDGTTPEGNVRLYENEFEAGYPLDQVIKIGASGQYHDCFGAFVYTPGSNADDILSVYARPV